MKISLGTIGIGLSILVLLQFLIFDEAAGEGFSQPRSIGIVVSILVFAAGTFAFWLPRVGGLIFVVSAFLAFSVSSDFPDMAFWGSASLILGTLSGFFGWKEWNLANGAERD